MSDEQQIRDLVAHWMEATKVGDVERVLDMMTDDVVFLVAGQEPFGKEAFRKSMEQMQAGDNTVRFEGESNIEELKVMGDWAFARNRLKVTTIKSDGSQPTHRAGYTLTIFHKESNGNWRLARDANLLNELS